MSRELLGSASGAAASSAPGSSSPDKADPVPDVMLVPAREVGNSPAPTSGPVLGAFRMRVAAVVAGSAAIAGLVGGALTAAVLESGGDQPRVLAWLEFGDGGDYPGNDRIGMVLNVVNAGQGEVVIDDVDLDGGLAQGAPASAVEVGLDQSLRVAPGAHAQQDVLVGVSDCETRRRPALDDAGSTLRVRVTGADARSAWIGGSKVGAVAVTSSTLVQAVCDAAGTGPVITRETSVSADGALVMVLRSTGSDAQVLEVEGPSGVRFTGEPSLPVTVPGRDDESVTVSIRLVVDDCTNEIQQLDAASQVRFVVGEQDVYDYDFMLVHSWYVREVTRACG